MIFSLVSAIAGIIELILGLRFVFRLLGANPDNSLVSWIYGVSAPLVSPFTGIFGQPVPTPGVVVHGTFEWASVLALVIYGALASIILYFVSIDRRHI